MSANLRVIAGLAASSLAALTLQPSTASAKQICGWYAIAYCSTSDEAAAKFTTRGWGQTINTNIYVGFAPGYFCVVSGPQPKASAIRDQRNAIATGVSNDTYIKRACTDEANVGD